MLLLLGVGVVGKEWFRFEFGFMGLVGGICECKCVGSFVIALVVVLMSREMEREVVQFMHFFKFFM